MFIRQLSGPFCTLVLVFSNFLVAHAAERPTAAQLLPENTVVYLRVANVPELKEKFQQTALGKISGDPQIKPLVTHLYGSMTEAFARVQEQVGSSLGELLDLPQGEIAFGLIAPEGSPPAAVLLFEVGDQLPSARKLIEKGEAALANANAVKTTETVGDTLVTVYVVGGDRNRTVAFCEKSGTYVMASSADALKQVLARWAGKDDKELGRPLTQNEKFAAVMKRCQASAGESAPLVWYVDAIAAAKAFARGNTSAQVGLAVLPTLGLDGLQAVGGSVIFGTDDFDMVTHAHLLLENPRGGVLKMIALKSGETAPESWVPADAASYTTFHWDVPETYTELGKLYNSFRGENALANDVKANLSNSLGVDFETDLLPAFEGRASWMTWVEKPAKLNARASLLGLKLKDAKAFAPTLDKIGAKFPNELEAKTYAGVSYWRMKNSAGGPPRRRANAAGAAAEAPPEPAPGDAEAVLNLEIHPCLSVFEGYLLMADRESVLERCIAAHSESGKGLAAELDFKLIASKIRRQPGGDTPGLVTFDRPEEGLRMLYDMATGESVKQTLSRASERNDFFKAIDGALKTNPLPPFAVVSKYLAPAGGMVTTDDTGFHYTGFVLKRK